VYRRKYAKDAAIEECQAAVTRVPPPLPLCRFRRSATLERHAVAPRQRATPERHTGAARSNSNTYHVHGWVSVGRRCCQLCGGMEEQGILEGIKSHGMQPGGIRCAWPEHWREQQRYSQPRSGSPSSPTLRGPSDEWDLKSVARARDMRCRQKGMWWCCEGSDRISAFSFVISLVHTVSSWDRPGGGACNVPPSRGLGTGKRWENARRHGLCRLHASTNKPNQIKKMFPRFHGPTRRPVVRAV